MSPRPPPAGPRILSIVALGEGVTVKGGHLTSLADEQTCTTILGVVQTAFEVDSCKKSEKGEFSNTKSGADFISFDSYSGYVAFSCKTCQPQDSGYNAISTTGNGIVSTGDFLGKNLMCLQSLQEQTEVNVEIHASQVTKTSDFEKIITAYNGDRTSLTDSVGSSQARLKPIAVCTSECDDPIKCHQLQMLTVSYEPSHFATQVPDLAQTKVDAETGGIDQSPNSSVGCESTEKTGTELQTVSITLSSEGIDGACKTLKLHGNHTGSIDVFKDTPGKITLTFDETTGKHHCSVSLSILVEADKTDVVSVDGLVDFHESKCVSGCDSRDIHYGVGVGDEVQVEPDCAPKEGQSVDPFEKYAESIANDEGQTHSVGSSKDSGSLVSVGQVCCDTDGGGAKTNGKVAVFKSHNTDLSVSKSGDISLAGKCKGPKPAQ